MGYDTVQFLGRSAVLTAYGNVDYAPWMLIQGKQLLTKFEDDDKAEGQKLLDAILTSISDSSGSQAMYTLRVYDLVREKKPKAAGAKKGSPDQFYKIKLYMDTPYDGSFNFRLIGEEDEQERKTRGGWSKVHSLEAQVTSMQETIKKLSEQLEHSPEEEQEEKLGWVAGIAKELLGDPRIKGEIIGRVINFMGSLGQRRIEAAPAPAKIAGPEPIQISQEQADKANQALGILAAVDPELGDNLLKLAAIAQESPTKYESLVSMLKTFR